MAMLVKKGTITAKTSTGSQSYTGVGFQPKAIIFWGQKLTAAGYGAGDYHFIGCATGSANEWVIAGGATDAQGTVESGRIASDSASIYILATGVPTADAIADFTSFDADGFTLNWSDAASSAWLIHYLALGGSDITNAMANNYAPGTGTGSKATTQPGFQPEFLLMASIAAAKNSLNGHDGFGIGMAAASTQRGTLTFRDKDALGTSDIVSGQVTDKILNVVTTSTGSALASSDDLVSFDANGFTLNRGVSINQPLFYLALRGGDYFVGNETQKTSTGTKATTGAGFRPAGLFGFGWNLAASASVDDTVGKVTIGGADENGGEGHTWFESDDNNTATDVDQRTNTDKVLGFSSQPSTTNAEADLQSFDSDGFTLNWTTADGTARQFVYALFGPGNVDTTPPVANITVGPSLSKISSQTSFDSTDITFTVDEACQAWKVKVVPATSSVHTDGTQIESGGSVSAGGTVNVNITDDELSAASAGDGAKIVKFFVQDLAGNWST